MELGPASPTSGASARLLSVGLSDAGDRSTGVLYEDKHVRLTQDTVTINWYYFPHRFRKDDTSDVHPQVQVTLVPLPPWRRQQWKHWGMGIDMKRWWPCDLFRGNKMHYMEVDTGEWSVPAVTAEDASKLYFALSQALEPVKDGGTAVSGGQAGAVDPPK